MPLNVQASQLVKDKRATKQDAILQRLATARPAQVDAWIDNNVTDLASAKRVLKTLAKAVVILSRDM